jgi:RNA polymerase sigma factor (sigma-70 family)
LKLKMTSDPELLRQFAQTHSEDAFAELVRRHVNLVYSTALRRAAGDAHLAQDVAQSVFTDLARKANSLSRRESLTAWLYTSAHFAAAKIVRTENRRREREEKFMREPTNESAPETDWEKIRPVLDDVMHELEAPEREAVLLRYFENRPFAEVGAKLGLNENAARMRVERALEKLRALLAKRAIATSAALASLISANAVQLAPANLAATLATTSMAAAKTGVALSLLKFMTATKLKFGLGALVSIGAATALVVQHQTQEKLRVENESLRQQIAQLETDNETLSNRVVPAPDSKSLPEGQFNELLRLRGQVGVLRRQTNELGKLLANAPKLQPQGPNPAAEQQASSALPDDYPKTPDGATKGIFEAWARGDWNAFVTNFAQPGVPREFYDQVFTDQMKSNLVGMEIVSIGQPTNSFAPNKWWVPYKIRLKDGSEKEFRLSVGHDPTTRRWYFDGGF